MPLPPSQSQEVVTPVDRGFQRQTVSSTACTRSGRLGVRAAQEYERGTPFKGECRLGNRPCCCSGSPTGPEEDGDEARVLLLAGALNRSAILHARRSGRRGAQRDHHCRRCPHSAVAPSPGCGAEHRRVPFTPILSSRHYDPAQARAVTKWGGPTAALRRPCRRSATQAASLTSTARCECRPRRRRCRRTLPVTLMAPHPRHHRLRQGSLPLPCYRAVRGAGHAPLLVVVDDLQ